MKYKVIKEFGSARKGDILENSSEEPCMFTMEVEDSTENGTYYRSMSISDDLADAYEGDGYLMIVDEETAEDTIEDVLDYINGLIASYSKKLEDTEEEFKNGTVQPCVKLESDTVYTNLLKVLLEIKKRLINE